MTGRTLCAARFDAPPAWRATVNAALRAAGGIRPAAVALMVSARTLHRWLNEEPSLASGAGLRPSANPALRKTVETG